MDNKRFLYMPILKTASGSYEAVLSDTSIDRDDELMSKSLLNYWAKNSEYIPALMDHENKVLSNVAVWKNPRVVQRKGHNALVMTPKFFDSNPNAKVIKGMIDEGAQLGVSIGAIPKDYEDIEIKGKTHLMWTKAELLEASFTPIPSNRHAQIYMAKSIDLAKKMLNEAEGKKMPEDNKLELEKLKTQLDEKTSEAEELQKKIEDLEKAVSDKDKGNKAVTDELAEVKKSLESQKDEIKKTIDEFKKSFDEELEKKVKDHLVKLPQAPGYMDEALEAIAKKKAEVDKKAEFSSDDLLKAYSGGIKAEGQ